MGFWIFIVVLSILAYLLDKLLRRLFKFKKMKISDTPGKKVDYWGRGILLVLFICTMPFFVLSAERSLIIWFSIFQLIAVLGFQAFLEWRYLKDSRQYISTLIFLILGVMMMYNLEYFVTLLG